MFLVLSCVCPFAATFSVRGGGSAGCAGVGPRGWVRGGGVGPRGCAARAVLFVRHTSFGECIFVLVCGADLQDTVAGVRELWVVRGASWIPGIMSFIEVWVHQNMKLDLI